MGKLFKPSVPKYTPVSLPQPAMPYTPPETDASEPVPVPDTQNFDAAKDVIRRVSRGRDSTILTSLRGVLRSEDDLQPRRKSLLGE